MHEGGCPCVLGLGASYIMFAKGVNWLGWEVGNGSLTVG